MRGFRLSRMRVLVLVAAAVGAAGAAHALDHDLYAQLLERHTREVSDAAGTRVDYAGLRRSADWTRVVASLSATDPAALSDAQKMAFWINAYNILTIDLVVKGRPEDSIRDLGSFFSPVWKETAGTIGGNAVTLHQIEHEILRPMGDPRIHAAIVCASISCPSLLREPWRAERLDDQFGRALRRWLADSHKGVAIDRANTRVQLSSIFKWFSEDFDPDGAVVFAARYLPDDDARWLSANAGDVGVSYLDYDWNLNRWLD